MGFSMKLLLDTCSFLWLTTEPKKLSKVAKKALSEPSAKLFLSEVTVLEICFKVSARMLTLPQVPAIWIEDQIDQWELEVAALSRSSIYREGELQTHHKDPFDRLLVAQALELRAAIVSPDSMITKYSVDVIW